MEFIDCKKLAHNIKEDIRTKISELGEVVTFAIVSSGNNDANSVYEKNKIKDCEEVGILGNVHKLCNDSFYDNVYTISNQNTATIVQLPIDKELDATKAIAQIDALADADCLTAENIGRVYNGTAEVFPATALGIVKVLESLGESLVGKDVVVVGRSLIVGKPIAELLIQRDCTVTICHSKTKNLQEKIDSADIVIAAIGKAKHLVVNNPNAILIDVGINRDENGKLCGDFDIEKCNARLATPVPGGIGLMTRACLLENIYNLAKNKSNK